MDLVDQPISEEDERRLKNLATRIMSNGVEVLVKDKNADKLDQTKNVDVKTIEPSTPSNIFMSNLPKLEKRINDPDDDKPFDLIQPSEPGYGPCKSSCPCPYTKTESLKTHYSNHDHYDNHASASKYGGKFSKLNLRPTKIELIDKSTRYDPYEYENSQLAPTDRIVEKYTEVINEYSDEKESNSVEKSELLTNEQAPFPPKTNKKPSTKAPERKPEKPQKPNKNKVLVADLLKLGSLGIKGLSQLAPVLEKMTGGFIKRQESNKTTTTTTSKPEENLTPYHVNKRVDNEMESKQSSFPIYIPVDLETSESQMSFTNATLHQNLVWAAEHKQPKSHIIPPKMVHESPLVNGGIPISPGEIITANSDVIVGKPAVGGPLTLAASGIKLHNPVNPPPIDSYFAGNQQHSAKEKPTLNEQALLSSSQIDDSFDLRPPELPKPNPSRVPRPTPGSHNSHPNFSHPPQANRHHPRLPPPLQTSEYMMKTEHIKPPTGIMSNHGRPAFLDYIPSLDKQKVNRPHNELNTNEEEDDQEVSDNNPSSSEIVSTRVKPDGKGENVLEMNSKPFLVDIQPSKVANVLIPHGSATALVFAGSSEPHKTGDYVDDPLPYTEPGYFGTFNIDAPQMTNIENVPSRYPHPKLNGHNLNENYKSNIQQSFKDQTFRNDLKIKWKDTKRPIDYNKLPPPTSNQESHVQIGPKITAYNPDIYRPNNGDFEKFYRGRPKEHQDSKKAIDNEYENYLAVPPPPPPKLHYSHDGHFDKKPYSHRPVVHTKPVQDMNIFLNIQHPVPQYSVPQHNAEALPTKVTSEIYFAAQAPNTKQTPAYSITIPPSPPSYESSYNQVQNHQNTIPSHAHFVGPSSNSFTVVSSPNFTNNSVFTNDINGNDNSYTITLNTATNVASNTEDNGQVIGSSIPVAIGTSSNVDPLKTDIPIGTNFAIRVEEDSSFEGSNKANNSPKFEVSVGDNRWNQSKTEQQGYYDSKETTIIGHHYHNQNTVSPPTSQENVKPTITTSINSHANFPMINDNSENTYDVKPVTEVVDELKSDPKRPAKLIPNIPTNSHGWYSKVIQNENKINNIQIESTTRKIIPFIHEYNKQSIQEFGQKISSAGKPPSEFWAHTHNTHYSSNNFNEPTETNEHTKESFSSKPPLNSEPFNPNYIPSYYDGMKQPAYDIPIRDNSDETTTAKVEDKPVYENSEEVYDGEEVESTNENEDDFSSESIKIPVITASEEEHSTNTSKKSSEISSQDTRDTETENNDNDKSTDYSGTQTEKPFGYSNTTSFQTNTMKPVYQQMKPRPFTINTVLDHQLQQPHWQINQLMVNSSNISYEENLELNTGEEMSDGLPKAPQTPNHHVEYGNSKNKRPPRPVYVNHHNNRDDPNIITSIVHINDKKPLLIGDSGEKSTMSPIAVTTLELNRSSSEIIDLSPPPPTMDNNFNHPPNDEMIMGMSPPPPRTLPPRTQPPIRNSPRLPSTPRPIPIRTPPPYRTKPLRTLPPRTPPTLRPIRRPITRDEVSTYRPPYDTINNVKRPIFNRNQPSSQLIPPRDLPSRITPINVIPSPTLNKETPNVVFPTLISSGWLTSSGVGFSSNFEFAPTSVHFPEPPKSSSTPVLSSSSTENTHSYEVQLSSESFVETSSENIDSSVKTTVGISTELKMLTTTTEVTTSQEGSSETGIKNETSSEEQDASDVIAGETSDEDITTTTDKMEVIPIGNRNRTRKPYPVRSDEKKSSTNKYKLPPRPTLVIRPTRTLTKPEILYSTRQTSTTRRITRLPVPTKLPPIISSVIESSESSIDDNFVQPTEILKENASLSSSIQPEKTAVLEKSSSVSTPSPNEFKIFVDPTRDHDNEFKVFEVVPTKTEFKTTVITLIKTLSEPPKTVSSIEYVNLTHTHTVTRTMTSLVSQSEGAITQTLVLTNTHTSTIVDVITKVQTQVQPTIIVETVTKHVPVIKVEPTPVQNVVPKTKVPLDDVTMSSEEEKILIIKEVAETTENIQKIHNESEGDTDTFFVVMNKSQNGGKITPISNDIDTNEYDITRNEQVNSNGVSQILFGEILLAGTPYLETTHDINTSGIGFSKECQPDCKASRNERCQRIDGIMKCVCRPGFARMFPDRPCKPTYTYSVKLALDSQGSDHLEFYDNLADNSSKQYHALAIATHEGINRMIMQSDLRDVYHGVHITGFHPVTMKDEDGDSYQGVMNDFYVQLSDNAHESRLKEVIEKYLRQNNYSLGDTDVYAARALMDKLEVSDFDECTSPQFNDCSEHSQCFNLRGTYTCSCLEGFADLSVNNLYPGRICSAEPVGCERCNYHGSCYSRDDQRVLCECFQWYAGSACHINLKVVLISLVVLGALLTLVLTVCAVIACRRPRPPTRSIVTCIQTIPSLHQASMPSKRADRRALINDRTDSGDASSVQNASLPYMPAKRPSSKKCTVSSPPGHDPPPPPPPAVMIPRARLLPHQHHSDSRENIARKKSTELTSEAKLINYLESGAVTINTHNEMRRKHSMESSYSAHAQKDRHNKQGALVSAGFKVSTTIRPDEPTMMMKSDRDDTSSINKNDLETEMRFDSLRKSYSQEDMSEWTDAERRIGELTLSEARSVGGTLPASTGRAASSTRLTHQEAHTMAERDLGSTFLLPHVHLYKPDLACIDPCQAQDQHRLYYLSSQ